MSSKTRHTSFLSFSFTQPQFVKFVRLKVREFERKVALHQNSVNYHPGTQIMNRVKIMICMLWKILHLGQNFYTTSGCDGCDKYEVCSLAAKIGFLTGRLCRDSKRKWPRLGDNGNTVRPSALEFNTNCSLNIWNITL